MSQLEVCAPNGIKIIDSSIPQIRYSARSSSSGPEEDMVRTYLDHMAKKRNYNDQLMIFKEPMIDSGYPDIVIVSYCLPQKIVFNKARKELKNHHFKVLFEIDKRKSISKKRLANILGYNYVQICVIISDLEASGLVYCKNRSVFRIPYKKYYFIHSIVAVEAKLNKWSDAIEQAIVNTRFANTSYILMGKDHCSPSIEARCREQGIGVILGGKKFIKQVPAKRQNTPNSYLSFLFNEWILRFAEMGCNVNDT